MWPTRGSSFFGQQASVPLSSGAPSRTAVEGSDGSTIVEVFEADAAFSGIIAPLLRHVDVDHLVAGEFGG